MLPLINEYDVGVIQDDAEADLLAALYVDEGIIPLKYRDDALRIAVASIAEMHIILSWNFQHIVKLKTRNMVNDINTREGYRTIEICSPKEVIGMIRNEPAAMKEIHAIRLDNFEHTKELTPEERSRLRSESAMPVVEKYGFRIVPKVKANEPLRYAK